MLLTAAQGWERRHERMVAEVRMSASTLTQREETISQLQMELRRANVQIKELLDITNGSIASTGDSDTSGRPTSQREAAIPHKPGLSWKQLALQVESMTAEHVEGVDSPGSEAVVLSDGTQLSVQDSLSRVKRQIAQLRGELDGERDAKHSLEDELAKCNREYEQLKLELPALQEKYLELSNAEKASLDELADAEQRAISAEEEVLRRQQILQILANEVDGIVAAADGDAVHHRAEVMVSWDRIRRMHEAILSVNPSPQRGWHTGDGAPVPTVQLHGAGGPIQAADLLPSSATHSHHHLGVTAGYGLAHTEDIAGFPAGMTNGPPLQQPQTTAILPPWQPRLDMSAPGLGGIRSSTSLNSSTGLGLDLGARLGKGTAQAVGMGAASNVLGPQSTSAQAERFRARLEAAGPSASKQVLPKRTPSSDSLLANRPSKPRPSIMETLQSGGSTGASDKIARENPTLHSSSQPNSDVDAMTLKAQAALQSAKAAAAGGTDASRSTSSVSALPSNAKSTTKEDAMRQRAKEMLKAVQEQTAATAGT